MQQGIKYQKMLAGALESCPLKVVMSGGAGKSMVEEDIGVSEGKHANGRAEWKGPRSDFAGGQGCTETFVVHCQVHLWDRESLGGGDCTGHRSIRIQELTLARTRSRCLLQSHVCFIRI